MTEELKDLDENEWWRLRFGKEPFSAWSHFLGFVAAIAGLVLLISLSAHDGPRLASMTIYGICVMLVFLASSVYHYFDLGEEGNLWLKRFDHCAIFLMIGGSYIPSLVILLEGMWRLTMLSLISTLSVAGIIFKLVWIQCPRWLSVSIYVAMGWLAVIPTVKMWPKLEPWALGYMVSGGLAYTVGAVVYAIKKPDPWPKHFGFHEIWHIFVLLGAVLHYLFVLQIAHLPRAAF